MHLSPEELSIARKIGFNGVCRVGSPGPRRMDVSFESRPAATLESGDDGIWRVRQELASNLPEGTLRIALQTAQEMFPDGRFIL